PTPSPLPPLFLLLSPPPPSPSTLFPYTTLFRSSHSSGPFRQYQSEIDRELILPALSEDDWFGAAEGAAEGLAAAASGEFGDDAEDRKSTRLNSSHVSISYAVFCLKKKKTACVKH